MEYFGEPTAQTCGNRGNCVSGSVAPAAAGTPFPVRSAVVHTSWGPGTVMREEPDRITVLFEEVGYKTLSLDAVQRDSLLPLAPPAAPAPATARDRAERTA